MSVCSSRVAPAESTNPTHDQITRAHRGGAGGRRSYARTRRRQAAPRTARRRRHIVGAWLRGARSVQAQARGAAAAEAGPDDDDDADRSVSRPALTPIWEASFGEFGLAS